MSETTSASRATTRAPRSIILYNVLVGLCAVAVLLQGLWAGLFLEHDGQRDQAAGWIGVHARCGEIALALAVLATVVALARLRARRDLLTGSIVLVVLLVVESYVGGLIVDDGRDTLTALHVPLALAIMALVVWLAVRATRRVLES